jgi:uridine phosphorylase
VSYPLFPDKYKLPALLTAEKMMDFRRQHGGTADLPAPHSVLICLYKGAMRRFAWKYPGRRVGGFLGDVYLPLRSRGRVAVLGNFGIGAPAITNIAEEMMAWGAHNVVVLSLAGGLQSSVHPADVIVCERALRDEGTSYHYLPPSRDVQGSPKLVSALSQALAARGVRSVRGATWSTDAPYRESREEADLFAGEGVQAVDMESAGVFAAAQARGKEAASVLVIGDSLATPRWSAPPNMRALHLRLKLLLNVLIDTLGKLEE